MRKGKDIDLGLLVGSTRGCRTKEDAMSGGFGGMEMDEVPVLIVSSPSPQKRNGKGKERAVESDVEMCDGEERRGRSKHTKGLCFFFSLIFLCLFILLFAMVAHLFAFRTAKRVEITTQSYLYTPPCPLLPHTEPDLSQPQERSYLWSYGRQTLLDKGQPPPKLGEDRMPPKMRK